MVTGNENEGGWLMFLSITFKNSVLKYFISYNELLSRFVIRFT